MFKNVNQNTDPASVKNGRFVSM